MDTQFPAIIFARQNLFFKQDKVDTLTPQLFRTTKYCLKKDLVILQTFFETHPSDYVFYKMINYITDLHKTVAVVFDSAKQLPTYDFGRIVLLDFLFSTSTIEIHLVKENMVLMDIKSEYESKMWSKYTNTHPKKMQWLRNGIDVYKYLELDTTNGLHTNLG